MKRAYVILGADFDLDLSNFFDEISVIDFDKSIDDQLMILDEDLLLLSFKSGDLVDVGWYPAFEKDGNFVINKVINNDWDSPEYQAIINWDKSELINKIIEAIGEMG